MSIPKLGRLERVDVRKAWSHEAQDFTPWLADNLNRLAAELGLEFELEDTEKYVGPFRADIVARVPQTDDRVLIENQLEWANLQHLGQVLAYLAGLEAKIVVWVAAGFLDEHLTAIRWLNERTVGGFAFFAVQVSVVRIGDSQLAPVFDVLERPNEWHRQVQELNRLVGTSGPAKFRREFWEHFAFRRPEAPKLSPGFAGSNPSWGEEAGFRIRQYIGSVSVGTYLRGRSIESEEEIGERLRPYWPLFENAFDEIIFGNGNWWCSTVLNIGNTRDRSNWDQMATWLDSTRQKYEEILRSDPDAAA